MTEPNPPASVKTRLTAVWRALPPWTGALLALLLLAAFTIGWEIRHDGSSAFIKPDNLINILHNASFVGIIAVGMTLVITLGGIDLSVGSMLALAGGIGMWMMNTVIAAPRLLASAAENAQLGLPAEQGGVQLFFAQGAMKLGLGGHEGAGVALGLLTMLLLATLAGAFNGVLIAKGRIAPFIVTLGGLAAFRSLALVPADGGEYRSASVSLFQTLGQNGPALPWTHGKHLSDLLHVPFPIVIFALTAVLGAVLLNRTRLGRYTVAIGCNERAAVYSAIAVDRVKIMVYTLLGLLTGLSALLTTTRMNSMSSNSAGALSELDAIAAVVIGGTRITGGSGTIFGTVIGIILLGVINNMLNMVGANVHLQGFCKGAIIIAAALLQRRA